MSTPWATRESLPRSFLYVPAVRPELFPKATIGPADAVVIDLEDAVPQASKEQARENARSWLARAAEAGVPTRDESSPRSAEQWVRISPEAIGDDLDAAVYPALDGIFLAKCTDDALREVAETLDALEPQRHVQPGTIGVIGLVESAAGMLTLAPMTQQSRLVTFGLGELDLHADLRMSGGEGSSAAIDALRTQVVLHCAAAGRQAPVAPTSKDFTDLAAFTQSSRHLLDLGFRSRTAIHPNQVRAIHEVLSPDAESVAVAQDVMARFQAAAAGVTTDAAGRLIDEAVVRSARETLSRAHR